MNDNIKIGIGFLVPAAAIIAFFYSIFTENYLLGVFFSIAGILVWFIYTAVMQTKMPNIAGNIIIVFGVLLSFSIFLNYGWERNIFGGFIFNAEGAAVSVVFLFFSVLLGILFRNQTASLFTHAPPPAPVLRDVSSLPEVADNKNKGDDDESSPPHYAGYYDNYYPEDYEEYYREYYDDIIGEYEE
ncbi:MAG: hypothetical protein U9N31_10025 [Candidatus Marinimicrobia bacterium]|nr:hypothetical protein [Candidatus Neomarinimicrobiota bacterium]